ncbi:GNAT family N-acetyltransferase [Planotetraspora kaengkrachanensis]|uniref:Acetyltransferase n=1 Tax=Planotetraspora kaengkrachanensis TaxID=575193 RepID=A0A8J3M7J5_9ACTN|nr:GNAT family N-acetyltransferase [Planotetraspora kaengkrachanensis]GIG78825.1 acetyltransferase [Planotetraspora kaengkrachanensis]
MPETDSPIDQNEVRPSSPDLPVRRLGFDDLPDCMLLAEDRDWSREERKWRLLFDVGEVYGIDDPAGGLAATVASTRYGTGVAAIGMMLVARRHERRGLGRRLMTHAMKRSGTSCLWLTATEYGRPLYERLGFRAIGHSSAYTGSFRARPSDPARPVSRPMTAADLPAVLALDAEAWGAPRTELVSRLPAFCASMRVVEGPSGVTAYGGAWRNEGVTVLGPLIARDGETASGLLSDLAAEAEGPLRLDVEHRRPALTGWAEDHGLTRAFTTTVMIHGDDLPGDRDRLFLPVTVALG